MAVANVPEIGAASSESLEDALEQGVAGTNAPPRNGRSGRDEEQQPRSERRAESIADRVAAAWTALEQSSVWHGQPGAAPAAIWHWDLAGDKLRWGEGLKALFGHAEKVTNAAWRESHIHPEDRDRITASLQRATIENDGDIWSDQYRFHQADGAYTAVTERAYVVHDGAGPRGVVGAITPTPTRRPRTSS